MDPATVFAEWKLERIPVEKLPFIASTLMAGGYDTPVLRVLAGSAKGGRTGAGPELFVTAMGELGLEEPSCEQAALVVARQVASRLLSDELSARDACADIAAIAVGCHNQVESLTGFYLLLEEWDLSSDGEFSTPERVEADIRLAASRLLEPDKQLAQAEAR
jgi:hypothetical protein